MPETRASLLLRLRDYQDRESWEEFVDLYCPLILRYLRGLGAGDEAPDLAQDILQIVIRRIRTFVYDPGIGRFRSWLRKVTVNRARRFFSQKRRRPAPGGSAAQEALLRIPDPHDGFDETWEREWRKRSLEVAMKRVRPQVKGQTWLAFQKTVLEDRPSKAVARELGMSVGQVYVSKSRVLRRLREAVEKIDEPESNRP